jgi:hypothetical protein
MITIKDLKKVIRSKRKPEKELIPLLIRCTAVN